MRTLLLAARHDDELVCMMMDGNIRMVSIRVSDEDDKVGSP